MEEWVPVVDYEGFYEVSDCGNVRSVERTVIRSDGVALHYSPREMGKRENADGYYIVRLSKNGKSKWIQIHRLVATAFLGDNRGNMEVNHIDYDRKNNNVSNLEWVTHTENIQHTIDGNRHISQTDMSGENNPNYGNRKLSKKYAADKELAMEKQSRPGKQNGRSIEVVMMDQYGNEKQFCCITYCAQYIIDNGIETRYKPFTIAFNIKKYANTGVMKYGHWFYT